MSPLFASDDRDAWRTQLARYEHVIEQQQVAKLPVLDRWYRDELSAGLLAREHAHLTHDELVRLTEWKMARGVWRAPNLVLVRGNAPHDVETVSTAAFALVPHPTKPISTLATLAGVGPATASAAMALFAPSIYPFFDELVAAQVPSLGAVKWTMGYYAAYAAALRDRAASLGADWTPVTVERALWANVGGKTGSRD